MITMQTIEMHGTEIKLDSYEKWKDFYDLQINALLSGEFSTFSQLVDYPDAIYSSHNAWDSTGHYSKSLFSYIPDCDFCATQPDTNAHWADQLEKDSIEEKAFNKLFHFGEINFNTINNKDFTKEHLENIRDRQLLFWKERY